MNIKIGSYEAKTKLPKLLRGIRIGNRYTITLRGEAVADLLPAQDSKRAEAVAAVDGMLSFMRRRAQQPTDSVDIKALVDEGRE
ncbi:MAG: type II toxin-antitoxin system Phd/YefM family antitoxin [Acidithiobacillus sp.]